jgi:endonuclease G, mitochondrial
MNKSRSGMLALVVALGFAELADASPPEIRQRTAAYSVLHLESQAAVMSSEVETSTHAPWGLPRVHPIRGAHRRVEREGYVLAHSSRDRSALWVCERIDRSQLDGDAVRRASFKADPQLARGARAELRDYRASGFDRGHLAAAADQRHVQRLKDETFYLSNMAPQDPAFNQRIWAALEREVRRWVKRWGTVFVITGGFFFDPAEEHPSTADGLVEHPMAGRVSVPTHFYKIVLRRDGGSWRALTFVFENRAYGRGSELDAQLRSVDWLEQRARLDFLPGLAVSEQESLERRPGCWGDFAGREVEPVARRRATAVSARRQRASSRRRGASGARFRR